MRGVGRWRTPRSMNPSRGSPHIRLRNFTSGCSPRSKVGNQLQGGEHTRPRRRIQPERHNRRRHAMAQRNPWILGAVVLLATACGGAGSASKAGGGGATSAVPVTPRVHARPSTTVPIGVTTSIPKGTTAVWPGATTHPTPFGPGSGTGSATTASRGSPSAPAPPPPTSPPITSPQTPPPPTTVPVPTTAPVIPPTTTTVPSPPTTVACNPPQGGGDQDADNAGGPLDGDGCAV
jgi:hypothetical protein